MIIESAIFLGFIIAILLSLSIRNKNSGSSIGLIYTFFCIGTILFFLSRLFLTFGSFGLTNASSINLHIFWHLIFYFGSLCFIIGGVRLKQISENIDVKKYNQSDTLMILSFFAVTLFMFIFSKHIDNVFSNITIIALIDSFGIHQLVALLLNISAIYYVFSIKNNLGKVLSVSVYPIVSFLSLTVVQYVWELFTESYKLIIIPESSIESVESLIIVSSLISLIYGYFLTYKEAYNGQNT